MIQALSAFHTRALFQNTFIHVPLHQKGKPMALTYPISTFPKNIVNHFLHLLHISISQLKSSPEILIKHALNLKTTSGAYLLHQIHCESAGFSDESSAQPSLLQSLDICKDSSLSSDCLLSPNPILRKKNRLIDSNPTYLTTACDGPALGLARPAQNADTA